jgi:NTP pyrophosphatase (non-canonical NTP hydrolase)
MSIKSLAMIKMEKNFQALEKGYRRQPYTWPIAHGQREFTLIGFVLREMDELVEVVDIWVNSEDRDAVQLANIREEIADVSNCLDYLYEAVLREEMKKEASP